MFVCDACYAEKSDGVSMLTLARARVMVRTATQSMYGICSMDNADHVGKVMAAAAKVYSVRTVSESPYPMTVTEYDG